MLFAAIVPCAGLLVACAAPPPFEPGPVSTSSADADHETPLQPCEPRIKAAVEKYLPRALGYPARSGRRMANLDMIDAEVRASMIGQSRLAKEVCMAAYSDFMREKSVELDDQGKIR